MPELDRRVALVTGAASGLGLAVARRLKLDGIQVVITDLQTERGNEIAAREGFTFLEQDVRDEECWSFVVQEVEGQFGGLHILVNNAGIVGDPTKANAQETSLSNWRQVFAVNVEGVFLGCRAGIPPISRSGGGCIINMSSVAGNLATPYNVAYGASKAAVTQLTRSVAQHCASKNLKIRVNSVHPGDVHTSLWERAATEMAFHTGRSKGDLLKTAETFAPMGGFTRATDVAAAVSFLASTEAGRITGTMLVIDGGLVGCNTYHMMRNAEFY